MEKVRKMSFLIIITVLFAACNPKSLICVASIGAEGIEASEDSNMIINSGPNSSISVNYCGSPTPQASPPTDATDDEAPTTIDSIDTPPVTILFVPIPPIALPTRIPSIPSLRGYNFGLPGYWPFHFSKYSHGDSRPGSASQISTTEPAPANKKKQWKP